MGLVGVRRQVICAGSEGRIVVSGKQGRYHARQIASRSEFQRNKSRNESEAGRVAVGGSVRTPLDRLVCRMRKKNQVYLIRREEAGVAD